MTYTEFVQRLLTMTMQISTDVDLMVYIPAIIDQAEQRIYRELNLISTVVRDSTASLTANSRNFTLPSGGGRFVTVTRVNVVTPVGSTVTNGTRNPLVRSSGEMIDFLARTETGAVGQVPSMYSMVTDQTMIVGPAPGSAFNIEIVGTIRPTPLSPSNPTTFLTLYLPDLFLSGAFVETFAFVPKVDPAIFQAASINYQNHFVSADSEETRKRYNRSVDSARSPIVNGATA